MDTTKLKHITIHIIFYVIFIWYQVALIPNRMQSDTDHLMVLFFFHLERAAIKITHIVFSLCNKLKKTSKAIK